MNFYAEEMQSPGAKSQLILVGTPGVERFTTTPTPLINNRGLFTNYDGRVFAISGTGLYEVFFDGSFTNRGAVLADQNPAYIASNGAAGKELLICSGGSVYSYDLTANTLTLELSGSYTHIGVTYGYGLALDASTGRVRISDVNDLATWDALNFFERSIGFDPFVSMCVSTWGFIYLFGFQSGEVWHNANNFPIPFAPHPSGLDFPGIAANFSVCQVNQTVSWLSSNKDGGYQTLSAQAFRPDVISNRAEEYAYAQMTDLSDMVGQTYRSLGHTFYIQTFFTDKQTRVYDFTVTLWHQRGTWDANNNIYLAWRPVYHCFAFGKHLVGDYQSGYLYEMKDSYVSDINGDVLRRVRRAPALSAENRLISYGKFELYLQPGNGDGDPNSQGFAPVVMMRSSKDGGRTWGHERRCGSGKLGQYGKRVFWEMNGQSRNKVFEVIMTDPVRWYIVDAFLDWKLGDYNDEEAA